MEPGPRHQCIIYAGVPLHQLSMLAAVMHRMMTNGYRCLYLNSPAMVASMKLRVAALGADVPMEVATGRLVFSSESACEEGRSKGDLMLQKLEDALDAALKDGFNGLWASGDMTWELGQDKNAEKLLEYEWKLEALFKKRKELYGICQYHYDTLPQQAVRNGLLMHRTVFLNETLFRLNPYYNHSPLHAETTATNPELDKMISELCQSNVETNRKKSL